MKVDINKAWPPKSWCLRELCKIGHDTNYSILYLVSQEVLGRENIEDYLVRVFPVEHCTHPGDCCRSRAYCQGGLLVGESSWGYVIEVCYILNV